MVVDVFLLGTPMARKDGNYMILKKRDFCVKGCWFFENEFLFAHEENHGKEPSAGTDWAMAGTDDDEHVGFERHVDSLGR